MFYLTVQIQIDGQPIELEINYNPGTVGRRFLPNGDSGYPAISDEYEVLDIDLETAEKYQNEIETAIEKALKAAEEEQAAIIAENRIDFML